MIVALRWTIPEGTSTADPVLQFREEHGEWKTVPTAVVPRKPGPAAPTIRGVGQELFKTTAGQTIDPAAPWRLPS